MIEEKIKISFIGMDPTQAIKKYVLDKIGKKENLLQEATSIEVFLKENKHSRGVEGDFRIDINVSLPNSPVRVEQSGPDMYANIDLATDILGRRLTRYIDRKENWEGQKPWKIVEAEAELEVLEKDIDENLDDYSDYIPKVVTRKKIKDTIPLEEGEAIERMELSGYDQYLFKNKSTGKIAMLYRRKDSTYGIVELD